MQTEPQITFHHLDASPALETLIRGEIQELEQFFDGITSCRVALEASNRHRSGGIYRVSIEVNVPREQIAVGRAPGDHPEHADAYVAVRDAFRAVRRRLEDYVRRLHGNVKTRAVPPHGRVVHLEPDLEYGRLESDDGREIYFHRHSVRGGIERLAMGAEVRYHEEQGLKGPQASTVEPIGAQGRHAAAASWTVS
ncbi:MAG TPA: HPF/RaiA family ribosome-associated protein [Polyangia bacterium]|nr:HPF/RaiA family ribosome-associated protein [Polyangia bacterium]